VLVITYNHERFVERAVRSVLSQKADFEYEIIVGEDCSTDETRVVLNRLDADFQGRLRLLYRERNLGPARNFHGAYAECRGDYVAYLDGDDYWIDPAKLRKQVALLDADPGCALCYHPTRYVGADGEPIGYVHPHETTPNQPTIDDLFRSNLINPCSAVVRRAAVRELPDWMLRVVPGDWPLFLLASRCWKHAPLGRSNGCLPRSPGRHIYPVERRRADRADVRHVDGGRSTLPRQVRRPSGNRSDRDRERDVLSDKLRASKNCRCTSAVGGRAPGTRAEPPEAGNDPIRTGGGSSAISNHRRETR
jgi:glycosyltransferase involved in cell wall biosynthesis